MLVQITKILEESAWSSPEDKEFFEGKVFYIPKEEGHLYTVDRKWKNLPPITFLIDAELFKHKDLSRTTIPLYSFSSVEVKILQWEHDEQRAIENEIISLREQVKKLENRLNKDSQEFTILCAKETEKVLREQLATLAEQNAKMRKALTKWQYLDSSYNWRCGHCGNEVEDGHKEGCALSLPNLATSILNKEEGEIK